MKPRENVISCNCLKRWISLGWRKLCITLLVAVASTTMGAAQSNRTHVFPLVVDGWQEDGTFYSTDLFVTNLSSLDVSCDLKSEAPGDGRFFETTTFALAGITLPPPPSIAVKNFGPPPSPDTPRASWTVRSTSGQQPLDLALATLTCTDGVHARLVYTLHSQHGNTIGIASASAAQSSTLSQFPVIHHGQMGKRLGLAVLNDTATSNSYDFIYVDGTGWVVSDSIQIPAGTSFVSFLDEILELPSGPVAGTLTIRGDQEFYSLALIFDGTAFTTLSAIPLSR